ncbi:FeoA family protein [Clostridium fallax]|uniref:Ferrous iron transport protein A n=1 Tax=Clostridium fallax TaxID=1533 RepID=A0A1M4SN32_9CLOT|nr:FeoA domain-containing protein [Clostridium fallax]SHE33562.1 ferrous iron transport protein A [Clostridium fallax]SQB07899.1 feoA family protein [Clostridium fallax]
MIMPVAFIEEGKSVIVNNIIMSEAMGKKLREMGIAHGSSIDIIKNDGVSVILGVSGSRLALDMSMARKIMVQQN